MYELELFLKTLFKNLIDALVVFFTKVALYLFLFIIVIIVILVLYMIIKSFINRQRKKE